MTSRLRGSRLPWGVTMTELPDGGAPVVVSDADSVPSVQVADGEPIELLVQLAQDGEIDPWDIDIVRVTDKFLERLDRSDLRTSGRALFYASVLLRMKSDVLLTPDEPDEPDPEPWEEPWEGPMFDPSPERDPIQSLEGELDRRLERQRARGSPETLDELVRELRDVEREAWWKNSRTYDTSASPHGFHRGTQTVDYHASDAGRREGEPTESDVTGTAHAEDLEAIIAEVRAVIETHYDAGRNEVLFAEVADAGGSRVMTYLAVVFLAHREVVRLVQDDLFGDLWIQRRDFVPG